MKFDFSDFLFYQEKPIFLKDHLPQFTLCIISRMVMSGKYYSDESKSNDSIVTPENL